LILAGAAAELLTGRRSCADRAASVIGSAAERGLSQQG
jgi:hypothetical protein